MRRFALFAFSSEPAVFAHVLLNALDLKERGNEVRVIVEADATKQVSLLRNETKPFANLWRRAKEAGLIDCVCQACAQKNTVVPAVKEQGLALCGEMNGHPSIGRYLEQGYEVMVF
ncbi:MAG: DsrE family protein [candidate division WOR-3 bacterium]